MRVSKSFCTDNFIDAIFEKFKHISETRDFKRSSIPLVDCLMSCFAVFTLKWPSLLKYDERSKDDTVKYNLKQLFHVSYPPSDTYMRERLDNVEPESVRPAFKKIFALLQQGKMLEQYQFIDGYYLFSIDGTGHFSSDKVHCDNCCTKLQSKDSEKKTYYHNTLSMALMHPHTKIVIPLCPEPIFNEKGVSKNDCEQNATKRLLQDFRREHPHLKAIVVQDALSNSGPNVRQLESLGLKYIIVSKGSMFNWERVRDAICTHEILDKHDITHYYRFVNGCPLNGSHLDVTTNYIEYKYTDKAGKQHTWDWITNIFVTKENVHKLMQGGRTR